MALTPTPVCVQTPKFAATLFSSTYSAGALQLIYTAGANGSKIMSVIGLNSDTATLHVGQLWLGRGGTSFLLGSASIAANSGNDGVTSGTNLLGTSLGLPQDNDAQLYFFMQNGDTLSASLTSTLPAGKNVYVNVVGADF